MFCLAGLVDGEISDGPPSLPATQFRRIVLPVGSLPAFRSSGGRPLYGVGGSSCKCRHLVVTAPRELCRKLNSKKGFSAHFGFVRWASFHLIYTGSCRAACDLWAEPEPRSFDSQSGLVATQSTRYRFLRWVPAYSGLQRESRFVFSGQPEVDCTSWSVSQLPYCYSLSCFVKVISCHIRLS